MNTLSNNVYTPSVIIKPKPEIFHSSFTPVTHPLSSDSLIIHNTTPFQPITPSLDEGNVSPLSVCGITNYPDYSQINTNLLLQYLTALSNSGGYNQMIPTPAMNPQQNLPLLPMVKEQPGNFDNQNLMLPTNEIIINSGKDEFANISSSAFQDILAIAHKNCEKKVKCCKCQKIVDLYNCFALRKNSKYVCLNCSKEIEVYQLSDWEKEITRYSPNTMVCSRCKKRKNCYRFVNIRNNRLQRTCSYCLLKRKLQYIVYKT